MRTTEKKLSEEKLVDNNASSKSAIHSLPHRAQRRRRVTWITPCKRSATRGYAVIRHTGNSVGVQLLTELRWGVAHSSPSPVLRCAYTGLSIYKSFGLMRTPSLRSGTKQSRVIENWELRIENWECPKWSNRSNLVEMRARNDAPRSTPQACNVNNPV